MWPSTSNCQRSESSPDRKTGVSESVWPASFLHTLEYVRFGDAGTHAAGGKIAHMCSHDTLEQLRTCNAEGRIMRTGGDAGRSRRRKLTHGIAKIAIGGFKLTHEMGSSDIVRIGH